MKTTWQKIRERASTIAYPPFEHFTLSTLYAFLAGIFASIAAQLFITPPISLALPVCAAALLCSAALFLVSSAMMIWISFELEAFREDFIQQGSPRDQETRRRILTAGGLRQLNRLRRLWIAATVSIASAVLGTILLY